ncbi:MAG: hypothetical protein J5668_00145 [Bacteroidales bacterium]|nr:hypothetical protein [Bacteroidales bacterium]
MKRVLILAVLFLTAFSGVSYAQSRLNEATLAKREARKNLIIKEWNTDAKSKTKWLDRITKYDELGRKIEEIEYNQYGVAWREVYEYDPVVDKIAKETKYNSKNKPILVRKYEYDEDGTRRKQYNYAPNGKLLTIKVFEYSSE